MQLENAKYPDWPAVEQFYGALLDAVRQQPGIEVAGVTNAMVLQPGWRVRTNVEGRPAPRVEEAPIAQHVTVSDGYFETFRARLVAGRFFQASDTAAAEPVIVVNESLAQRLFPGEEPIGRRLVSVARQIGPLGRNLMFTSREVPSVLFRIVGVVADVHQAPIGQAAEPVIYHTQRQFPFRAMTIVARGGDTATVVSGIRQALRSLDGAVALSNVQTMDERLVTATAAPRLLTAVLTTFAVLTGLLAAIGVYGLLAWTVNERRRELAITDGARRAARRCRAAGADAGTRADGRWDRWSVSSARSSPADCCRTCCSRPARPTRRRWRARPPSFWRPRPSPASPPRGGRPASPRSRACGREADGWTMEGPLHPSAA